MAEETLNIQKELEKAAKEKKLKVGLNSVLRALKQGTAAKVFYANNTPKDIKDEIDYYSKIAEVMAVQFSGDSRELGIACKRNHMVLTAVISKV